MQKNKGFTLIELVVVIVILGILAVTAAPRFLNLQRDARQSALHGLKGSIASAANLVYGKAAIENLETSESEEEVEGIHTIFGYPDASIPGIGQAISDFADNSEDWSVAYYQADDAIGNTYIATFKDESFTLQSGLEISETDCYVHYYILQEEKTYKIDLVDTGC